MIIFNKKTKINENERCARLFTLSDVIDQGKITAKMDNGVLRLVLPKVEKVKPQKIKVTAD